MIDEKKIARESETILTYIKPPQHIIHRKKVEENRKKVKF